MKKIYIVTYCSFFIFVACICFVLYLLKIIDINAVICSLVFLILGFVPSFIIECYKKRRIDNLKILAFLTKYYEYANKQYIDEINSLYKAQMAGLRRNEKIDNIRMKFNSNILNIEELSKTIKIKIIKNKMKMWEEDFNLFVSYTNNLYNKLKPNIFEIKQYDIKNYIK